MDACLAEVLRKLLARQLAIAVIIHLLKHIGHAPKRLLDAATDKNLLLRDQPGLTLLLLTLDAADYARVVDQLAESSPRGWDEPLLSTYLSVGPHTISPEASARIVHDAMTKYGPLGPGLVDRFPLKLDRGVADLLHGYASDRFAPFAKAERLSRVLAKADLIDEHLAARA